MGCSSSRLLGMSCHGWSHPFPPQATLHSSLPFASFILGQNCHSHPCRPHIHAAYTSMMLTHTHSSCIHEDHRTLQPTYSCRPHIHAAHTYVQSTCPCNSHAAHKSMEPIHACSPHIHTVHTCMQPTRPCIPPSQVPHQSNSSS